MQNLTVILIITAGFDNLFDYPELLLNQTTTTEIRKKSPKYYRTVKKGKIRARAMDFEKGGERVEEKGVELKEG